MKRIPPEERLLAKVDQTGDCWIWTDAVRPDGYTRFWLYGRLVGGHVAAYRLFVGPIPAGRELDHLCHTRDLNCLGGQTCLHRRCVRPDHLEPVSHLVNTLRGRGVASGNVTKTHCPQGHPYDTENTYATPKGSRICRMCKATGKRATRARGVPESLSLPELCLRALGSIGGSATTTQVLQYLRANGELTSPVRVTNALSRLASRKQPLAVTTQQGTPGGNPSTWELTVAGHLLLTRDARAWQGRQLPRIVALSWAQGMPGTP